MEEGLVTRPPRFARMVGRTALIIRAVAKKLVANNGSTAAR